MDTKTDPLSDDAVSQNKRELFNKNITMNTNSDDGAVKTEIKSENPFTNFSSQSKRECLTKQTESETVTSSNFCEIYIKTEIEEPSLVSDFGSQNVREFLPEVPVIKCKKYNSDHETDNKIEVKEEPLWLQTQPSSVSDDIKDWDIPPVTYPRLCLQAVSGEVSGKSPLPSAEHSWKDTSFCDAKELPESNITEVPTVEEHIHLEQPGSCNEGEDVYSRVLYQKQQNLICENIFTVLSAKKTYRCETCNKSFSLWSSFKKHKLIHEGYRTHKCGICDKTFTQLSNLKNHNLIHEGKKPHTCEICYKSFTQLSHLKRHILIHEGKKPHKCEICDQGYSTVYHLKRHKVIHQGEKPHKCETCDESFTHVRDLKGHYLIHEGKKPHRCEICDKRFTCLSDLKIHNLIHEGKKPHKCKVCDKSFTRLSDLKGHNVIHEGKRPYKCEICDISFTRLSHLKSHNLTRKHYTAIQT